nr:copper amine oxidase N-terminal domain-containing protein [Alkaliphilus sp. B6464]
MIPLRILSETLNYKVEWDNEEREATISKDDKYIKLAVGYHNAKVNNSYIQLPSVPEMKDNTVYVPLRVVSDALGLQVGYVNRTAYISTSGEPIKLPTANKQIPLKEVPSLLLSNGYKKFGSDDISYLRHAIGKDGMPYQISFSQVVPEMQLMQLSLHENNSENLDFVKLLLNSLVPTEADEIYTIISTQDIIPLKIIKSDGYQVGILAKENHSSLELTFDASKEGEHISNLTRDVEASKGR